MLLFKNLFEGVGMSQLKKKMQASQTKPRQIENRKALPRPAPRMKHLQTFDFTYD